MAKLMKIDRNGSKHYEGLVTCDRCGGNGYYAIGVHNGMPVLSPHDGGVCWKCLGKGKVMGKWIERTPEYQAKLDARRQAKAEALAKERAEKEEALRKETEAKKAEEEARRLAMKAVSQYVGTVGKRFTFNVRFVFGTSWDTKYGTQYLFSFKDGDGNVLTWKTSSMPMVLNEKGEDVVIREGDEVVLTGTVKEHTEYRDEKQTVLTRCKLATA